MRRLIVPFLAAFVAVHQESAAAERAGQQSGATVDGPPAPVSPAVMARDGSGRTTVRAVRLTGPLQIDGRLTEGVYSTVPPIADFLQMLPSQGMPASEKTEAWILFDAENVYVAARCWDSTPEGWRLSNELRRDANQIRENDHFAVSFTIDATALAFPQTRSAAEAISPPPTKGAPTLIGIRYGTRGRDGSRAGGASKWSSRSSRCGTGPARPRSGASSSDG